MPENGKVNILLVDDQPGKLLSYEAILDELGENLIKVNSGLEALKVLMTRDVAVVLVDVIMPEMDGFELATLIREHPRFRRTAIILVSAVALSDVDRLRGYDSGAVDYMPVPIVPEVLRARIAVFVELYRKSEELRRLNVELEERVADRTSALEASTFKLRENEERLRIALEAARLGAWDLDVATGRMETNPICKSILGRPDAPELDREMLFAALCPEDRDKLQRVIKEAISAGSDFELECSCCWPDGSTHWIIVRGRPLCAMDGTPVRLLGVVLDISERRRIEEERGLLLESERAARHEAERAVRIKDEFLATLSHELRTPLNAILGWAQVLRRGRAQGQTLDEGLETIERNARDQARLIDDLLSVSRLASGRIRLHKSRMNLADTVKSGVEAIRPSASAKGLTLECDLAPDGLLVEGDAGRLQQVFSNLLSNAVKFTPRGGTITVSARRIGHQVEMVVQDTGEGIQSEFLPLVFDRFRQADSSTTRQHGGLGLGLAISKHLVELHGGTIRANSAGKDRGAQFTVCLPAASAFPYEPAPARDEPAVEVSLAQKRILVVDDDRDSCDLLKRYLLDAGAEVCTAYSANEALDRLRQSEFDLLLSDIGMPGRDGYDLMREMRGMNGGVGAIPAVAVTAFVRMEDRARALEAGYDDHIGKPVNAGDLLATIARLLLTQRSAVARPPPAGVAMKHSA